MAATIILLEEIVTCSKAQFSSILQIVENNELYVENGWFYLHMLTRGEKCEANTGLWPLTQTGGLKAGDASSANISHSQETSLISFELAVSMFQYVRKQANFFLNLS